MNNMKRVVLLSVLLGAMALSLRAQESSHREPSFLPAVGVAAVANYTVAWEAGTVAAGVVASTDQKIFLNAGLGSMSLTPIRQLFLGLYRRWRYTT